MIRQMYSQPERRGDRGATAIIVAGSLFLLMGLAALAIDSGILFDDRRQQQSAADGGALAAVQFAKTTLPTVECTGLSGPALAACRGAEEAIDVVDGTLPGRFTLTDWSNCTDPNKPAEYIIDSSLSVCISFTENFQKARVVLPTTAVDTSFARAIGFDTVDVGAFAEAGLDLKQSADIIPFALGPSGAGSSQACLFANPAVTLDVDPCNGPEEGNFGMLDVSLYGNSTLGTPEMCGASFTQTKMATNIVVGSDHPMEEEWVHPASIVHDWTNCPIITNPVDQLRTQTGNSAVGMEDGLFYGISQPNLEGRLMCKGSLSGIGNEPPWANLESTGCVNVFDNYPENLDDSPLWDYLDPAAAALVPGSACDDVDTRAEMEGCLNAWKTWGNPTKPPLFTSDIVESPRFGGIPVLEGDPSDGAGDYMIDDFLPVYMETIYVQCSAMTCNFVHSPGQASSGSPCPVPLTPGDDSCGWPPSAVGTMQITAMTAFIMSVEMLPEELQESFPYRPGTIIYNLTR